MRPHAIETQPITARLCETQIAALDSYAQRTGKNRSEAIGDLIALGYLESLGPAKPGEAVLTCQGEDACSLQVSFTRAQYDLLERLLRVIREYPEAS